MFRILVIDDETSILKLLETTLRTAGYEPILANNGEEGLRLAEEERPNLILLDVRMPKLSGWEVLRRLRQEEETKEIPVILLTALPPSRSNLTTSHILEADGYIAKPFDPQEVISVINEVVDRSRKST